MAPWQASPGGVDLSAGKRYVANAPQRILPEPAQLLTHAHPWARLEYATVETAGARGNFALGIERHGTAHGLLLWFDAELVPGVHICNGPGHPPTPYCPMFLPWPEPVAVEQGDRVGVDLRGNLIDGDYVWSWETRVIRARDDSRSAFHFRQSTFLSAPLAPRTLARRASGYRPNLSDEGRLALFVLSRMGSTESLGDIAAQLMARHAGRFGSQRDALDFVAALSGRYSE
jgi:type I protein arginine methyltransferase